MRPSGGSFTVTTSNPLSSEWRPTVMPWTRRIWSGRQSGREQVIGLVEALWHQAVMLSLSEPAEMGSSLTESARKLAGQLEHSESFTAAELRRYAVRRMRDDGELQQATSSVNGLFDRLVAIVGSASGS